MITLVTVALTWSLIVLTLVIVNRWAKRRGPHWILNYDPSRPLIEWEDAMFD